MRLLLCMYVCMHVYRCVYICLYVCMYYVVFMYICDVYLYHVNAYSIQANVFLCIHTQVLVQIHK